MLKVKAGDLDKLALLFERYNRPLFGFFYRSCGRAEISEDLVQNVFMRMLKYKHTFTGDGKFTTWMYHLARNVLADHFKKKNKSGYTDDFAPLENMKDSNDIQDRQQQEENLALLRSAIGKLSPDKQEVLVLSRYQGLKYKEIAEILQCTEANVKVRVYRAVQELRKIYLQLEKL
jgi:RNA polymerase sigma-70 factor (ECF subfamily)